MKFLTILLAVWLGIASAAEPQRNLGIAPVSGEKRVALVVGNSKYPSAALRNPANDARDMAAALRKIGFDVIEKTDVTQKEMNRAITQFGSKLTTDTIALFFYAGHGMQVRGKNYLIPIDAQIENEASVRSETVDVDAVLDQLSASSLNVVILDACRNNPFERRFRSVGGGLAQMDAPKGTLIAYATSPGKVASDGEGRNGLYTQELLRVIQIPGLEVEKAFKRVRANVARATGDNQIPWEASSLTGEFSFNRGQRPTEGVTSNASASSARLQTVAEMEQELWDSIKDSGSVEPLEEYLNQYPNGRFVPQSRVLIAKIKSNKNPVQVAMGATPGKPPVEADIQLTAGQTFKDCADCPEMVVIPDGSFQMGAEDYRDSTRPVHVVRIGKPFALGKTEVTQGQWKTLMGNNPSHFSGCGDDCPVEKVSWDDAQEYVRKLSQKTGKSYRLPSEAEWEYACRAGSQQDYCGSNDIDNVAWYDGNSGDKTHPVARKQANAWSLYDMNGNVWEWVQDFWNKNYESAPADGSAWATGAPFRVERGGSWADGSRYAKASIRNSYRSTERNYFLGFRLARVLPYPESVTTADQQLVTHSASSQGRAKIYFLRPASFAGSSVNWNIMRKDRQIGHLANNSYFEFLSETGKHIFSAGSVGSSSSTSITYDIDSGKTYYIELELTMGKGSLQLISEEEGKTRLKSLHYEVQSSAR